MTQIEKIAITTILNEFKAKHPDADEKIQKVIKDIETAKLEYSNVVGTYFKTIREDFKDVSSELTPEGIEFLTETVEQDLGIKNFKLIK